MSTDRPGRTLRPLLGVRAIAKPAGLDGREVAEMVHNGRGRVVASMIRKRQIHDRAAERSSVDWAEFLASLEEIN